MPHYQDHLIKANANRSLYEQQKTTLPPDWQAVILFYAAVHFVEALADVVDNFHSEVHNDRDLYVKSKHKIHIGAKFARLKNESIKARYISVSGSTKVSLFSLNISQVEKQLYHNALVDISTYCLDTINRKLLIPMVNIPNSSINLTSNAAATDIKGS